MFIAVLPLEFPTEMRVICVHEIKICSDTSRKIFNNSQNIFKGTPINLEFWLVIRVLVGTNLTGCHQKCC